MLASGVWAKVIVWVMRKCYLTTVTTIVRIIFLASVSHTLLASTNPIIRDRFTADPAPLVYGDTVYLYVGHDEAKEGEMFSMWEWLCYSSKDVKNWTYHGPIMQVTNFKWAVRDAWAAQVVERNGKFYLFATAQHDNSRPGKAIGVAIADKPTGPFVDARGSALITDDMTPSPYPWDDIDPTVFIDDDGTPWMAWGNRNCYLVRLKPSLVEFDGPIHRVHLPNYTEGPWLFKRGGLYYLVYAAFAHQGMWEKICYATATNVIGPWVYRGIVTDQAANSYTIHPGIIQFHGQWYFFYHNAVLELPDGRKGALGRRSVCVEYMFFDPEGLIMPIKQTVEGVSVPAIPPMYEPRVLRLPVPSVLAPSNIVYIQQNVCYDPTNWPGNPVICTVTNPYYHATETTSFNYRGSTNLAQTFTPEIDFRLQRVAFYGGDGFGVDITNVLAIALFDLGKLEAGEPDTYGPRANLLEVIQGLSLIYQPQPPGIIFVDFAPSVQPVLRAGHTYALEIQGLRDSAPFFWYRTRRDAYRLGAAYANRTKIRANRGPRPEASDFAVALYGTPIE